MVKLNFPETITTKAIYSLFIQTVCNMITHSHFHPSTKISLLPVTIPPRSPRPIPTVRPLCVCFRINHSTRDGRQIYHWHICRSPGYSNYDMPLPPTVISSHTDRHSITHQHTGCVAALDARNILDNTHF